MKKERSNIYELHVTFVSLYWVPLRNEIFTEISIVTMAKSQFFAQVIPKQKFLRTYIYNCHVITLRTKRNHKKPMWWGLCCS